MSVKSKKPRALNLFSVVFMLYAAFMGVVFADMCFTLALPFAWVLPLLFFMLIVHGVSAWLAALIHELGHMVMGLLTGYEFVSLRIGSFMLVRTGGRFSLRRFSIFGTSGQCILTHAPSDKPQDLPYFAYHLGGVLFNLLTAVLCVPALLLVCQPLARAALLIFSSYSLALTLMNGIPSRAAGIGNDGYNLRQLRASAANRSAIYKMLRINGLQYTGIPLTDMPKDLIAFTDEELHCAFSDGLRSIQGNLLADRRDFAAAERVYRSVFTDPNAFPLNRNECGCEMMTCMILGGRGREAVEGVYTKALKRYVSATQKTYISRKLFLYAYALLIRHNEEDAEIQYRQALALERTFPNRGEYIATMALIESVRAEYAQSKKE